MKKIFIVAIMIFYGIFCKTVLAWDLYKYPIGKDQTAIDTNAPDMGLAVIYYFESEAINVQHNSGTETASRLAFSAHIIAGRANQNELSRQVSTNLGIGAKLVSSDPTYVNDIAYVVSTSYSPEITTPLFTIVANALFPE